MGLSLHTCQGRPTSISNRVENGNRLVVVPLTRWRKNCKIISVSNKPVARCPKSQGAPVSDQIISLHNRVLQNWAKVSVRYHVDYIAGEANQRFPEEYLCSLPAMIADWRQKWSDSSATATQFPFGQVQVSFTFYKQMSY